MTEEETLTDIVLVECLFGLGLGVDNKGSHQEDNRYPDFRKQFNHNLRKSLQQLQCRSGTSHHESREATVSAQKSCAEDFPAECLFVSTGTQGVVDLGASQTVIGSVQIPELLKQLPVDIGSQIRRVKCNLVFRFGNQQTLTSHHALMVPLQDQWFRIAVVPGRTPFLLSSSFLKHTLQAIIDTEQNTLYSKRLKRHIPLEVTDKNLYLMDLNRLWDHEHSGGGETHQVNLTSHDAVETDSPAKDVISSRNAMPSHVQSESQVETNQHIKHAEAEQLKHTMQTDKPQSVTAPKDKLEASQPAVDQATSSVTSIESRDRSVHQHGTATSAIPSAAKGNSGGTDSSQCDGDDPGSVISREDRIWQSTCGQTLPRDVPQSRLHGLVCGAISRQQEASTHEVCALCRTPSRPRDQHRRDNIPRAISKGQGSRSTEPDSRSCSSERNQLERAMGSSSPGGRDRRGVRDVTTSADAANGGASELHARREQEPQQSHEQNGIQCRGDLAALASDVRQAGTLRTTSTEGEPTVMDEAMITSEIDWDFDFVACQGQTFKRKCSAMIHKMNQELQEVSRHIDKSRFQGKVSRADVIEVVCHDQSELFAQCSRLGGVAFRFGLKEGDLSTSEGRKELFHVICTRQPTHIWFSPKCGPWSMWSNFNMNRSKLGEARILQEREESLWQISLAVVLFRFQQVRENHFHMEQPQGSAMWKVPTMEEIIQQTARCVFDLCRVGDLTDPESGKPIRKRLTICTTSELMMQGLDGKKCLGENHQQIVGSTKWHGKSIKRSEFSEHYPPKFGRQLAKILLKEKAWSCPVYVQQEVEHPTKRRRLGQNLSPSEIVSRFASINWQAAMQCADKTAPRVGTLVVENGTLFNMIQSLCPNHDISHLVLCRGTDRSVGPNKQMTPGSAPLRKFACIRRRFEDVQVDSEWEPWERLSYNALRRKTHAARVGLTIFARVKLPVSTAADDAEIQNRQTDIDRPEAEIDDQPPQKRFRQTGQEEKTVEDPSWTKDTEEDTNVREHVDLIAQKHGPKFLALDQDIQRWLIKIHRNMGHPGNQKLMNFCRQIQCPEAIVQGVADLKCSTCLENKSPNIARPSAIHETQDFGDVVSMDGISWTYQKGQNFHFYHFLDQSTSFQTAIVSPSRTSEHAIAAIVQSWISWAGAPGILVTDSATEFTSEEFSKFLQRFNIQSKVIAADAHWQNSRAEGHGGILQEIITKMDSEESIDSYEKLTQALAFATHTKNQWSRHRGYPPELLVLGKGVTIHGSNISDQKGSAHSLALSDSTEGQRFKEELNCRERARRAYASVDNDQTLRRALVHRVRPHRGSYQKGEAVMVWRKRGESDGHWQGPMTVVIQEDKQVVWVTMLNKLYRVAPEHIRPLSAMEEIHQKPSANRTSSSIVPSNGGTQNHNQVVTETMEQTPPASAVPNQENDQPDQEPSTGETPLQVSSDSGNSSPSAQSGMATAPISAEQIPIPVSDSDDGLFCEVEECFHVSHEQKWEFEIMLSEGDIQNWRQEEDPHECAFIVSAAKKQRSEVRLTSLSADDKRLFEKAKNQEIDSWISTGTIAKILRHQIPAENIMRCRWILTWKSLDPEESKKWGSNRKPKARLVVLGYEDPQIENIPRDSPTMSKLSRMFVMQTAASHKWNIESFDIKTAFLRGTDLSKDRKLGIEPSKEMRDKLHLIFGLLNSRKRWNNWDSCNVRLIRACSY